MVAAPPHWQYVGRFDNVTLSFQFNFLFFFNIFLFEFEQVYRGIGGFVDWDH